MLQHNITARHTHAAHAAVVALHAICCGLPALAVTAVAVSGAASGFVLASSYVQTLHALLHGHELWLIGVSALFVTAGGVMELMLRRRGGSQTFPWMFAVSLGCFLVNVAILAVHRAL